MSAPEDVNPEWVDLAARAIHEAECCPLDQDSQCYGWPLGQETERARAALAAVLPLAQAAAWDRGYSVSDYEAYHLGTHGRTDNPYREGTARCNCGYGGYHEPENPDCDTNKEEA